MRSKIKFARSSMILVLLSGMGALMGGARGCFGDDAPVSVGSDDAGTSLDAEMPESDSGTTTTGDAGALDGGIPIADGGASHVYTWEAIQVGHGDNDFSNPLTFDGLGAPHIVSHWETSGGVTHDHAVDGVWAGHTTTLGTYTGSPDYISDCASYANVVGDSTGQAHIVYLASDLLDNPSCSIVTTTKIEYVTIVGDTASAPLVIAESSTVHTPSMLLDDDDVVHLVYREGAALSYRTIDHGVLGERSDIPSTDGVAGAPMFRTSTGDILIVYISGGALYRRTLHEGAWSAAEALPVDQVAGTAYDSTSDTLHFARLTDRHYVSTREVMTIRHTTITLSGAIGVDDVVATNVNCQSLGVAVDSTGEPALACGIHDVGINFYGRLASGGWSTAQPIRAPAGSNPPQSPAASLVFDHADVPHVAFQGWPGAQLYYASPH